MNSFMYLSTLAASFVALLVMPAADAAADNYCATQKFVHSDYVRDACKAKRCDSNAKDRPAVIDVMYFGPYMTEPTTARSLSEWRVTSFKLELRALTSGYAERIQQLVQNPLNNAETVFTVVTLPVLEAMREHEHPGSLHSGGLILVGLYWIWKH